MSTRLTGTYSWSGGSYAAGEEPYRLFDGSTSTKMTIYPSSWPFYVVMNVGAKYVIDPSYTIYSANDYSDRDPKSWTLQGSPDNSNWTVLDTETNHAAWPARYHPLSFTLDQNPSAYQYFKWTITANQGSSSLQASELQIFGNLARLITVSTEGDGTVSPTTVYVGNGNSKTFTITPDGGNVIASITYGGVIQTITNPNGMDFTDSSVTEDATLSVIFRKKSSGFFLFM